MSKKKFTGIFMILFLGMFFSYKACAMESKSGQGITVTRKGSEIVAIQEDSTCGYASITVIKNTETGLFRIYSYVRSGRPLYYGGYEYEKFDLVKDGDNEVELLKGRIETFEAIEKEGGNSINLIQLTYSIFSSN